MSHLAAQQAALANFCQGEQVPGVAVAFLGREPRIMVEGVADLESGRAVEEQTVFTLASVTKSFTGLLFSQLERSGKISAEVTVQQVVPEAALALTTTYAHLLSHASGLGRAGLLDPLCGARFDSRASYLHSLPGTSLQSVPGEWFSYSNEGFALLGITIERLAGPLETVYESLLSDLGMQDSTPRIEVFQKWPTRAIGYDLLNGQLQRSPELPVAPASLAGGRLSSSIRDMACYGEFMLKRARTDPDALEFKVLNRWAEDYGYARGWQIRRLPTGPLIAHGGNLPGTATYMAFLPAEDIGVVVLSNRSGAPARLLAEELLNLERGQPLLRPHPFDELSSLSLQPPTDDTFARPVGDWIGPGGTLTLTALPDALRMAVRGSQGLPPVMSTLRPMTPGNYLVTRGPSEGQPAYYTAQDETFTVGGYQYRRRMPG